MKKHITIENLIFYLILAISASLPFTILLNSYLIGITLFVCIFYFYFNRGEKRKEKNYLVPLAVMYFLNLIAFFTSQNLKPVFTDLEQKLPLLAFPLIFLLGPKLDANKIRVLLISFVSSVCLVCLLSFRNGFYWGYFSSELYTSLLIRHPYLGMYCALCFFFCTEILADTKSRYLQFIFALLALFFVFFLIVLFAKMSLLTFLALVLLYLLFKLYYAQKKKVAFLIISLVTLSLVYAGWVNPVGREVTAKITSFRAFDFNEYNATVVNSFNLRMINWSCSVDVLFSDKNWLFGTGTGDAQSLLNKCYVNKIGTESFLSQENYNSHNQFFTFWLDLGLVPFLFFLFHFISALILYIRNRDLLAIVFTVGILLSCVTESIFEVQKGIVFYCLFQSIFLSRQFKGDRKIPMKTDQRVRPAD